MNEKVKQTQYEVKPARRYLRKGEISITQKSLDEAVGLVQDKDKYIAELKEHEKELIAEQHRLFDLAKEQENDLALLWRPIEEYFKEPHDWVLVQFKEKDTGFMPIPIVAEYRKHRNKWFASVDNDISIDYYNNVCEPVAFMEIPHYKKVTIKNKTARLNLNQIELLHLKNDLIHNIYDIKKTVFGDKWQLGCVLGEEEKALLTKEKEWQLRSYGYYERFALLEKLDKFENDNFAEDQCCGD